MSNLIKKIPVEGREKKEEGNMKEREKKEERKKENSTSKNSKLKKPQVPN